MKEVARIKDFSINELWFKYYVFLENDGNSYFQFTFDTLQEAIDYIMTFIKG